MIQVVFLVEGVPRVKLGEVPNGESIPAKGERVWLQGASHRVESRSWSYSWDSEDGIPRNPRTQVEVRLERWVPPAERNRDPMDDPMDWSPPA